MHLALELVVAVVAVVIRQFTVERPLSSLRAVGLVVAVVVMR